MPGTPFTFPYPDENNTHVEAVALLSAGILALQTDIEQAIVPAEIDWVSDLSARGYGLTNLGLVNLVDHGSDTASAGSVIYYAGEFYMVTGSGAVKLTLNGALNATGIGGIGGNYGGVNPAAVVYEDGSGDYIFTTDPGVYADLQVDDVILQSLGGGSIRVGAAAGVLSAIAYTLGNLPTVGTGMLTIDAAGNVVHSATVTVPQTFTGTMTLPNAVLNTGGGVSTFANRISIANDLTVDTQVTTPTLRGTTAIVGSGTLSVVGASTLGAVTAASLSVSGTVATTGASVISRNRTYVLPLGGVGSIVTVNPGNISVVSPGGGVTLYGYIPVGALAIGAVLSAWNVRTSGNATTGEIQLGYINESATFVPIGLAVNTVNGGITSRGDSGFTHTVAATRAYYLRVAVEPAKTAIIYSANVETTKD